VNQTDKLIRWSVFSLTCALATWVVWDAPVTLPYVLGVMLPWTFVNVVGNN
jgi:hypothetical protein